MTAADALNILIAIAMPPIYFLLGSQMTWGKVVIWRRVALCAAWGLIAFGLARWLGSLMIGPQGFAVLANLDFTLAGGGNPFLRGLSSNPLQIVSAAMIGFGLGAARLQKTWPGRILWGTIGYLIGIIWHSLFNNLVATIEGPLLPVYAILFATGGIGLMIAVTRTAQLRDAFLQIRLEKQRTDILLQRVIPLGIALSTERDFARLLETLIEEARRFAHADGGTLYLRTSAEQLDYVIAHNQRLGLSMGGSSGQDITLQPIRLFNESGQADHEHVASHTAHEGVSVNIPDVYQATHGDFSGPKEFDRRMGYRTSSLLSIPLKDDRQKVIGVLQLVNARDDHSGEAIPFSAGVQEIVESLAALAAAALVSYIRAQSLQQKVQVQVDQHKLKEAVAEITDSEFFGTLKDQVANLRKRHQQRASPAG